MSSLLLQTRQQSVLKQLKLALFGFHAELLKLRAGHSGKVVSDEDDLIKDLAEIAVQADKLLLTIQNFRKGVKVKSYPAKRGRDTEFESEIGRVGQIRGELLLLQRQLIQLKEQEIPEVLAYVVEKKLDPVKIGSKALEHMKEFSAVKAKYETIKQELSTPTGGIIHNPSIPQANLDGLMIGLTAILYLVLKKMKKGE